MVLGILLFAGVFMDGSWKNFIDSLISFSQCQFEIRWKVDL